MRRLFVILAVFLTGCGPQTPVVCKPTGETGEVLRTTMIQPLIQRWVKVEKMTCDDGTTKTRDIK